MEQHWAPQSLQTLTALIAHWNLYLVAASFGRVGHVSWNIIWNGNMEGRNMGEANNSEKSPIFTLV